MLVGTCESFALAGKYVKHFFDSETIERGQIEKKKSSLNKEKVKDTLKDFADFISMQKKFMK